MEILPLTDAMREQILQEKNAQKVQELAQKSGFLSLQDDGMIKVIMGLTSLEEVYRVSY